ncbi:MAG: PAS/PAC sensor hybrid histidine kinase, partial [uncultured bacterium]
MKRKVRGNSPETLISLAIMIVVPWLLLADSDVYGTARENSSTATLRVAMDNNYPPYVFQAGDGTIQGILIDQWRLFEKKTGIRVEIDAMDWGNALGGMKAGQFDVIDTIFKTEERSGWLDYTRPYARLEVPVFFNSQISGISDAASLQGFAVAAKKGDAAVDLLRSQGVENLMLFNSYEEIIRAARDRKVNVFVVDKPPALYFLYKFGIIEQYKESSPLYVGEFHRAVRKGDASTLLAIDNGFALITPAELRQIEKKWYGSALLGTFPLGYTLTGVGLLLFLVASLSLWNRSLRKAVETRTRALRVSEERYRQLFNAESDAIIVVDVATLSHVEVNEAAVDLYGYSHAELMALRTTDLSAEPEETRHQITTRNGHVVIPLRYHRKKDGTVFPVEITARFFQLEGQTLLLAAMRDISDRLKAEEDLRENRRFLSDLIENSGALIFVKNRDGCYKLVNRRWEEVTGLDRENVLGRTDEALFPGEIGRQFRRNDLGVMESGKVQEMEEILDGKHGRRFFLSVKFPLRNDDGTIDGICGMTTEITERKQAEADRERLSEQLAQAYKLESIGRLAGGIAHDFNNMLGVILGHIELALLSAPQAGSLHASLKEIEKAAQRSAALTLQLLAFARKQTVIPKILDLNEVVHGMLTILRRLIGEDIEFVWLPGEELWLIKMDPSQIDQILANLCANARDAINSVGKIVISTNNASVDADFCRNKEGCRAGHFVVLSITDTGCGMDHE